MYDNVAVQPFVKVGGGHVPPSVPMLRTCSVPMNMLRTINRIHTGWQKQSLMYINEHIFVYKRTCFILSGI